MNIFTENLNLIISTLLGGTSGGILGVFLGKKRRKAIDKQEEEKANLQESTVFQSMQKSYDIFSKDMTDKYTILKKELTSIKQENIEQRKSLRSLQQDNSNLHIQITSLTKENNELKTIVTKLSLENKQLHFELTKYKKRK